MYYDTAVVNVQEHTTSIIYLLTCLESCPNEFYLSYAGKKRIGWCHWMYWGITLFIICYPCVISFSLCTPSCVTLCKALQILFTHPLSWWSREEQQYALNLNAPSWQSKWKKMKGLNSDSTIFSSIIEATWYITFFHNLLGQRRKHPSFWDMHTFSVSFQYSFNLQPPYGGFVDCHHVCID